MKDVFSIDNFNIIQDSENYYFFRALNKADSNDIKKGITSTNGKIDRIRTDRERYEGKPNYHEDSEISLEEMFDHIKMHHSIDTNCISFTSNSNVGIMYGRVYYKDKYVILKVPKDDIGKQTVFAGSYMVEETEKRIKELIDNKKIDQETIKKIKEVDKLKTQEELDKFIQSITKTTKEKEEMYEKGIDFTSTTDSGDYNALSEEQNFIKNKLVTKINIIGENIIPSVSNQMLIKTIGNAFSSLELTHYKDVEKEEIIEVPTEIIDIFSLLQQVPKDYSNIKELKEEILEYSKNEKIKLDKYIFRNDFIDVDNDYTIERMYKLTYGDIDYYTAMSTYKKMYYLAKSKLRTQHTVELIKKITKDNSKYNEILEYIENNTYGIEPDIFTRQSKSKIPISESISLDFNKKERELLDLINDTEDYTLRSIIKDPLTSLRHTLRELSYVEDNNVDQETYYANAIIDSFDWKSLEITKIYHDQRIDIVDKLKENNCVKVYNKLKKQGVKEKDISNVLLTTIIKGKDINDIDLEDTFTVEELEDFLGYYKIKDTDSLKLRNYQASALENIDELFEENQFAAAVLPTGAGKSFVALAKMLENPNAKMLYLAPNVEILNQIKRYVRDNIVGKANSTGKSLDEIIKSKFPNLELHTYAYLKEDNAKDVREGKYDLIVFDEIHRTGAAEWSRYIEETINNQDKKTKVLGISATPQRDMDYKDMSNIWAEKFGYSREDIRKQKHLAINMDIIEGIKAGYIAHPRVISCAYTLKSSGKLEEFKTEIDLITDLKEKKELEKDYEKLRRDVDKADGIEKILKDNLKDKGKYIVFIPVTRRENGVYEDEDGNKIEAVDAKRFIQAYENQMKQYIFAGRFIDENIEKFKEIEKQLNKKEFSSDILKWLNKEKENIQTLSRIRTLESNNELLSKTNEIAEAILERMDWEELADSKKGKLLNDRTKEYIENYSMSSSYSDTHNTKQSDNFNSSTSDKMKFMFVMNKLNEGVHVKDIDGIIWLRPMDENSKILYLQQLGRCIYGLDPNKEVPEEERPLVIDFVNNTLSVKLEKGDIPEIRDLNALRIINDYIEQRGNPVLDINSTNKLEKQYAKSLKRINNKYNEYISNTNLIEELDFERKEAITEIIKEGSKIDLWHITFSEEIKSKKAFSKEESEDDILELFSITGIAKDFLELSKKISSTSTVDVLTIEDSNRRTKEYIEYLILEDSETGKKKGIISRSDPKKFSDGAALICSYLKNERQVIIKLREKDPKELSEFDKVRIKNYEKIEVLEEKLKIESNIKRTKEYIEYLILEDSETGKKKGIILQSDTKKFSDDTAMISSHKNDEKAVIKRLKEKDPKELSEFDKVRIKNFEKIEELEKRLRLEASIKENNQRTKEYIEYLMLEDPETGKKKGIILTTDPKKFSDGSAIIALQKRHEKRAVDKLRKKDPKELSEFDKVRIKNYEKIKEIEEQLIMEASIKENNQRTKECIEYLMLEDPETGKKKGIILQSDTKKFSDDTATISSHKYTEKQAVNKLRKKDPKELSEFDKVRIKNYEKIEKEEENFQIEKNNQRTKECIEYLMLEDPETGKKKGIILKSDTKKFSDDTAMISSHKYTEKQAVNKLRGKDDKKLSEFDKVRIENYEKIEEVEEQLIMEASIKENNQRTKEYIEYLMLEDPETGKKKGIISEMDSKKFSDGSATMMQYKSREQQEIKKLRKKDPKELSELDKIKIQNFEKIEKEEENFQIEKNNQRTKEYIEYLMLEDPETGKKKGKIPLSNPKKFSDGSAIISTHKYREQQEIKKLRKKNPKELSEFDKVRIKNYEKINFETGYYRSKEYYETYGDLKVITNYKCSDKFKLREFLDEQRKLFKKKNKTEVELEREKRLFDLYPGWVIGRIEDVVSSKTEVDDMIDDKEDESSTGSKKKK